MSDLSKLRKLAQAATPGPWRSGRSDMRSFSATTGEQFKNIYGPNFEPELHHGHQIAVEVAKAVGDNSLEDAALIAAMRNALPLLLDLVEAADRIRAGDSAFMQSLSPGSDALGWDEFDTKRAALAKMLEVDDG